jgi:maleylacetoacetate isomerase
MKLLSFFYSSTSFRVRIALALKGVDYSYQGINIRAQEQLTPRFTELNPSRGVPVLLDDEGNTISQSLAIIGYLDKAFPNPTLIPDDPLHRARVLELASVVACDIHPVNNLRVLRYLQTGLGMTDDQKMGWYRHWVAEGFTAVEESLKRYGYGNYCFGDSPTLADCCLVPQFINGQRNGCDLTQFPRAAAVYEYCMQQHAFQQAAPANQPDCID